MSLNDPHWGRGPAGGESDDSKRPQAADGSRQPEDGRDQDENGADRPHRSDRDERADRDERVRGEDAGGRRGSDRSRNEQRDGGGEDDLDRLWREFTDLFRGESRRGDRRDPNDPLSHLKSRDDFSRDDEPEDRRSDSAGGEPRRDQQFGRSGEEDRRGVYNGRPLFTIKLPGAGGGRAGSGSRKSGMGFGIIISSMTTKYRDLTVLVDFGVSLWMYATPVVYPLSMLGEGWMRTLLQINPVTESVELMRYAILGQGTVNWGYYFLSWGVTLVIALLGIVVFNKVERTFMDTV